MRSHRKMLAWGPFLFAIAITMGKKKGKEEGK